MARPKKHTTRRKHHRRGLHGLGSANASLGTKIKNALAKSELKEAAWALLAIPTWFIPASLFKLTGWPGLFVSFATTWFAGVLLDKKALRTAAFAIAPVHLTYVYGTGELTKLGMPPWRMGNYEVAPALAPGSTVKGFAAYMDAGDRILSLPNPNEIVSRPAMSSYNVGDDGALNGYRSADGTALSGETGPTDVPQYLVKGGNSPFVGDYGKTLPRKATAGFRMTAKGG